MSVNQILKKYELINLCAQSPMSIADFPPLCMLFVIAHTTVFVIATAFAIFCLHRIVILDSIPRNGLIVSIDPDRSLTSWIRSSSIHRLSMAHLLRHIRSHLSK